VLIDIQEFTMTSNIPNLTTKIIIVVIIILKGKAIPLQALTGPGGSRRLRLPHFKTIGT
jgi:hypothetical protein